MFFEYYGVIFWLFAAVFAALSVYDFKRMLIAIPAILPAYLMKTEIFGIPTNFLEVSVVILFVVWCVTFIIKHRWGLAFYRHRLFMPIMLFVIASIFTVIAYPEMRVFGVFKSWILVPLLFVNMVYFELRDVVQREQLLQSYLLSSLVLSLYAICQSVFGLTTTIDGRASSVFESANYLSLYIVPAIIFAVVSYKSSRWNLIIGAVLIITLFLTRSYAGWIAVFGSLILFFFNRINRERFFYVGGVVLLIGGLFLASEVDSDKFNNFLVLDDRSSSAVRLEVWEVSTNALKEEPLLGIGFDQFETYYDENAQEILGKVPFENVMLHPHNIFLSFWLYSGVLGLIAFGWLVFLCMKKWLFYYRYYWVKNMVYVGGFMLLSVILQGLFDTPFWKNDLAFIFWLCILQFFYWPKSISAFVISGNGLGKNIGFPTLNLHTDYQKIQVPFGVYACKVYTEEGEKVGALHYGVRKTIGDKEVRLEVHILDFEGSWNYSDLEVHIMSFIRPVKKFNTLEQLKDQIGADVEYVRKMLC